MRGKDGFKCVRSNEIGAIVFAIGVGRGSHAHCIRRLKQVSFAVEVRSRVAFPAQAQRMGPSGDVMVEFTVSESRQPTAIRIAKSSMPVFNDATVIGL